MKLISTITKMFGLSTRWADWLSPLGDLFLRVYIARVFFLSGLTKIQSWQTTLFLFKHEYQVPLLSPSIAAVMGTAAELILPAFVLLGLGARLPYIALFIFNLVAAYTYPFLWTDSGACAMKDHIYWGMIIGVLCLHGAGKLSLDYLLVKKKT